VKVKRDGERIVRKQAGTLRSGRWGRKARSASGRQMLFILTPDF
jgi:hypothetical protein